MNKMKQRIKILVLVNKLKVWKIKYKNNNGLVKKQKNRLKKR